MIAFVRGQFAIKKPSNVVVDVNGVGYDLQISLHTYDSIADKDSGQLFTYLHITDNGQTFFGFADTVEKELFLQLISVSGIGAATARMMLSGLRPEEIQKAIIQSNTVLLASIKGIGKKSAERLILELKDKFSKQSLESVQPFANLQRDDVDAVNALVALGIARAVAENAVNKVVQINPTIALQDMIKQALKNI